MLERTCLNCNGPFGKKYFSKKRKFCNPLCGKEHERKNYRLLNEKPAIRLPTGTVGAISELHVCCDLLRRGYEVFRAVSSHCSCDLSILKDGKLTRVEVTTGTLGIKGKISFPKKQNTKSDLIAVVMRDGKIHYFPELPVDLRG